MQFNSKNFVCFNKNKLPNADVVLLFQEKKVYRANGFANTKRPVKVIIELNSQFGYFWRLYQR
jgi:hypothetical protein